MDLLDIEDKSQGTECLHQPPLQGQAMGPDKPAQAHPARQAQDTHLGSSLRAQAAAAAIYPMPRVGAFGCRLKM